MYFDVNMFKVNRAGSKNHEKYIKQKLQRH